MLPSPSPATLRRPSFLTSFPDADLRRLFSPLPHRPLVVKIPPFRSEVPAGGKPPRRRRSYGSSRSSAIKKTFVQEPLVFTTPMSGDPVVGIIGGGLAGLVCSLYLDKRGVRSTVFDTGMHGLGGRMGTRAEDPTSLVFDHAAQYFTASDPRFLELVDTWVEQGLIREWRGPIGELSVGGQFNQVPLTRTRYIGVKGMRPLADSIISQSKSIEIIRPCWVSKIEPFNGLWHLSENGKPRGKFDVIIIAHNGKCANRLLSSSGLPLIAKQMKRLELSSIWALLAAFEDPLPIAWPTPETPFEGAFVKGIDSLSWMANNTRKLLASKSGGPHCWTFFSTATFGKRNKVPQENIPNTTAAKVTQSMLEGVELALGLPKGSLQEPSYSRLQLWGAALPTNTPGIPCIFDPQGRAGICGDWLLGSNLEAAALSGIAMANHVADYLKSDTSQHNDFAVGLHNEFQPINGHDIGQFADMNFAKQGSEQEMLLAHDV